MESVPSNAKCTIKHNTDDTQNAYYVPSNGKCTTKWKVFVPSNAKCTLKCKVHLKNKEHPQMQSVPSNTKGTQTAKCKVYPKM